MSSLSTQAADTAHVDRYPSRQSDAAGLIDRRDPVVYGDNAPAAGPLTAAQLEAYDRDGFLLLPAYFSSDDVTALNRELDRLRADDDVKGRREAILEPEGRDLRSLFAADRISDVFGKLAGDDRLTKPVKQILDSQVFIHQARINLKPAFAGKEFYWHSDFETWHVEDGMPAMRAVSCSILLTENTPHNGPLMVVPGSHRKFVQCVGRTPEDHYKASLRKQEYGVPDHESLTRLVEDGGIEAPIGPAGSVLLFDCNTMHGSNSNISPSPRTNLFFVYNSVKNRLGPPFSGVHARPNFIAVRDDDAPVF